MELTKEIILKIVPTANKELVSHLVPHFNTYFPQYDINTVNRISFFIGQCAEESASFRTLTEYASGAEYEGRKDLGNTHEGDGKRYKGRGIIQITGRFNYRKYGQILGLDLENNPELAKDPEVCVRVACEYWKSHSINKNADANDIVGATKKINGGTNGLSQRTAYIKKAQKIIKV